jgi:hypothetical protein
VKAVSTKKNTMCSERRQKLDRKTPAAATEPETYAWHQPPKRKLGQAAPPVKAVSTKKKLNTP